MKAFEQFLQTVEVELPKFKTTVADFRAAFEQEDRNMKQARGSVLTKDIQEQDSIRDRTYGALKRIVTAWQDAAIEPNATAAEQLARLIRLYNIDPKAQIDEETGLMDNFIGDVQETTTLSEAVDKLGLRTLFEAMLSANVAVRRLLSERTEEGASKAVGALKSARAEVDRLYDRLAEMIASLDMFVEDVSALEARISVWNGTVERYKTMLLHKSTKDTPEEAGV